jgi:hypothetical protein
MSKNGDQPAFPVSGIETDFSIDRDTGKYFPHVYSYEKDAGLTKRELIAALAMQGMLAGSSGTRTTDPDNVHKHIAKAAVILADALIEELGTERTVQRQEEA